MKEKNILQKTIENLSDEKDLRRVDKTLKMMAENCKTEEERRRINQARKSLRKHKMKLRRRLVAAICLACVLVVFLVISMGVYAAGRFIKKDSKEKTVPNTKSTVAESETVALLDEPVEILLSFTGDCILGTDENFYYDTSFNAYYENYGSAYFFQNVKDVFEKDDLTIINMEGTLTDLTTRKDKQFAFKGDPEYVKVLTNGSVEAANMANNHSYDYGEESFKDTVNILEKNKIRTFGDDETVIIPVKGVNVGIFGIYELDDHEERIPQVKSDIAKLKKDGADIIVAVFHWGNELERVPDDNQVMLAHLAIDEGADVVVGHHPHVLQGIDTYKGKTIAYSLGNFCFGGNYHPTEMDTMIFQQKFMIDTSKKITDSEINVIPCSVSSESDCNNYQPTILEGDEAKRVRELIQERSDQIG
ncbi:MAG: CapA family protein [Frisingicoccus sp.]|uniref:CapA family protein n=1 Tax=Frisingicoccus sp. TaxID=1918627 RepID=UPI002A8313CD|nr:CapA family protein [Frisingicoccus sp.]MDY4833850.1 CapA family protein [Frisingicoccus sp.]